MCKIVEDFREESKIEGKIETVKNMLKKKIPLETALECAQIDMETYEKYTEQFQ